MQIIPNCESIKRKKKVFLEGFEYIGLVLRNLQEPFIWAVVFCAISSSTNRQMRAEIVWVTTVKEDIALSPVARCLNVTAYFRLGLSGSHRKVGCFWRFGV